MNASHSASKVMRLDNTWVWDNAIFIILSCYLTFILEFHFGTKRTWILYHLAQKGEHKIALITLVYSKVSFSNTSINTALGNLLVYDLIVNDFLSFVGAWPINTHLVEHAS